MTQEQHAFEEWANKELADFVTNEFWHKLKPTVLLAWQASRESLKQELLSDEMVEKIAAAIDAEEHKNDCGTYPLAKRINLYGKDSQYEIFNKAKAALEAIVREI